VHHRMQAIKVLSQTVFQPIPDWDLLGAHRSGCLPTPPLQSPAAASDQISFLKALPDCRMRRGIRFPQWWILLVAILAILSGQDSLLGMERFAKRHRKTLIQLLGTHITKSTPDSSFRWLLSQLDVEGFESLLQ